jgi:hypothetical protein
MIAHLKFIGAAALLSAAAVVALMQPAQAQAPSG